MIILVEFLMACGLVAIVGSLIYTGYRAGKAEKKEEKWNGLAALVDTIFSGQGLFTFVQERI